MLSRGTHAYPGAYGHAPGAPPRPSAASSPGRMGGLPWDAGLPSVPRRPMSPAPPLVAGGLPGRVPARPDEATPPGGFLSVAPPLRSTLPSDPTARWRPGVSLVLRRPAPLHRGLSPPSMTACTAHTPSMSRALLRVGSMPLFGDAPLTLYTEEYNRVTWSQHCAKTKWSAAPRLSTSSNVKERESWVNTSACSCPNCQTWPFVVIP